jgi:cytochrome b
MVPQAPPASAPSDLGRGLRIWSLGVRLGHWTLAGTVLFCLVEHHGGNWHEWLGYLALAVALSRTVHGFVTRDRFARFSGFVRGPRAVREHLQSILARREARFLGHNPLGAWMIVALLTATLAAGASGALYVTDRYWGDETVALIHAVLGWSLAVLVPLHLAGVVFSSITQRENLVKAMLTGRKAAAQAVDSDK